MRRTYLQEPIAGKTVVVAVQLGASSSRTPELGVIEHVERLCPEFEADIFGDGEMLEQSHIEVGAAGVGKDVPSKSTEGQSAGRGEGSGVIFRRPEISGGAAGETVGIAHHVDVRGKIGKSVRYPSVIRRYGASASIVDIEGDSALDGGDS